MFRMQNQSANKVADKLHVVNLWHEIVELTLEEARWQESRNKYPWSGDQYQILERIKITEVGAKELKSKISSATHNQYLNRIRDSYVFIFSLWRAYRSPYGFVPNNSEEGLRREAEYQLNEANRLRPLVTKLYEVTRVTIEKIPAEYFQTEGIQDDKVELLKLERTIRTAITLDEIVLVRESLLNMHNKWKNYPLFDFKKFKKTSEPCLKIKRDPRDYPLYSFEDLQGEMKFTSFPPGDSDLINVGVLVFSIFFLGIEFNNKNFFHNKMTRVEAEAVLQERGLVVGDFIFRSASKQGMFSVSYVNTKGKITHNLLGFLKGKFQEEADRYDSISDYLRKYQLKNPISVDEMVRQDESLVVIPAIDGKPTQEQVNVGDTYTNFKKDQILLNSSQSAVAEISVAWNEEKLEEDLVKLQKDGQGLQVQLSEKKDILQQQQLLLRNRLHNDQLASGGSFDRSVVENIKMQVAVLLREHRQIQQLMENKRAKQQAIDEFKEHPHLLNFYKIICIRIENVFIGSKSVESEFVEADLKGVTGKVAKAVSWSGKLLGLIPIFGSEIKDIAEIFKEGLEAFDSVRITNVLKAISRLCIWSEAEKAAEKTARELTHLFKNQILALPSLEDEAKQAQEHQASSKWGYVQEKAKATYQKGKAGILKASTQSAVERFADVFFSQIVGALLDGRINEEEALETQFVRAALTPPSKVDKIKGIILNYLKYYVVTLSNGGQWRLNEVIFKTSIKISDKANDKYFGIDIETLQLYGSRAGDFEEVKKLGFVLLLTEPRKDIEPIISECTSTENILTTPIPDSFNDSAPLQSPNNSPPPPRVSDELAELRRQLAEEQEARKRQEEAFRQEQEMGRQRDKQIETLMKKIQSQEDETSVDSGNQLQVQAQAKSQARTAAQARFGFGSNMCFYQMEQRLCALEETTQIHNELLGSAGGSRKSENEKGEERRQVLFATQGASLR